MNRACVSLGCVLLLYGAGHAAVETPWFDGAVGGTATGGAWEQLPTEGVELTNSRYVLDGPESPFAFTPEKAKSPGVYTNLIVRTTVRSGLVYENCQPEVPAGKKIAIAVCSSDGAAATYRVYNGSAWVDTGVAATLDKDVAVVATVTKDGSDTKVAFSFDGTPSACPVVIAGDCEIQGVGYAGCGEIAALAGALVVGVEIKVDDVNIQVNDVDARRFEDSKPAGYSTADDFLAAEAKTAFGESAFKTAGLKVAEAYALGLVAADEGGKMAPVNGGKLEIKADAQAAVTDEIPLQFLGGVTPRTDTGATVTYQLQGSADGTTWTDIGAPVPEMPAIPLGRVGADKYRYFKVVTKLSGGAQ